MKLTGIISTAALSLFIGIAVPAHALQDQQDEKKRQEAKPDPKEAKPAPREERRDREDKPAPKEEKRRDEARPAPQDEKRGQENKPAPQEEKRPREDKPVPRDERRGEPQEQRDRQDERRRQDARTPQEQRDRQEGRQSQTQRSDRSGQDQGARQSAFREHRAKSWQSEHRRWGQRGGYHGSRIPEDRFRASFGESHSFRISSLSFQIVSGSPAFLCNGFWVVLVDPIPEFWADDWFDNDDVYIVWVDDGYYLIDRRYPSVSIAVSISA